MEEIKDEIIDTRTWTIYMHKNKINGKVYIGQTINIPKYRWGKNGNGYKHSKYFWRAIQKYGWDNFEHIILYDNILSKKYANNLEIITIDFYNSYDRDYGYNISKGGNIQTSLHKVVYQYDLSGNFINEYESITIAALKNGFDIRNISACCLKKKKSAYGYMWSFEKFDKINKYHIENAKRKKVYKYSLDGYYISRYNSITDAAHDINPENMSIINGISNCCKGKAKTAYGYIWRFEKYDKINYVIKKVKTGAKPIYQYTKDFVFIKKYESTSNAVDTFNGNKKTIYAYINNCLRGVRKSSYGFIWSYLPPEEFIK